MHDQNYSGTAESPFGPIPGFRDWNELMTHPLVSPKDLTRKKKSQQEQEMELISFLTTASSRELKRSRGGGVGEEASTRWTGQGF